MSTKSTLITIVIVLVVILVVWYLSYYFIKPQQGNVQQQEVGNAPDATKNISSEFQQLPSDSSLDEEMNSLDKELQNF